MVARDEVRCGRRKQLDEALQMIGTNVSVKRTCSCGISLVTKEEVHLAVEEFFNSNNVGFYEKGVNKLTERWEEVIGFDGDYRDYSSLLLNVFFSIFRFDKIIKV